MFSPGFSFVLAVVLVVLAIVFFLGKGGGVMDAFTSKNAQPRKKRSEEEERQYQRVLGIFCLVLVAAELILGLLGSQAVIFNIIAIAIVVVGLIFVVTYLKKNFPD